MHPCLSFFLVVACCHHGLELITKGGGHDGSGGVYSKGPDHRHLFLATFHQDNELLPMYVEIGECVFPAAGQYDFEIYIEIHISAPGGGEALKGEQPFSVVLREE